MRFRNLRIAFSSTCGIACVLLIGLWVRSYTWHDYVKRLNGNSMSELSVLTGSIEVSRAGPFPDSNYRTERHSFRANGSRPDFLWDTSGGLWRIRFPIWLLIVVCSTMTAIPWISWRFSLRTLLIATTLVAVVLGLIVALVNRSYR